MTWPAPQPGLVIRYSYLWSREAEAGREEGAKDRPCAVVLAVRRGDEDIVYVLPITHAAPSDPAEAVELPAAVKAHLGLDTARSWIVVSEANVFAWPALLRRVRDRFAANLERRRAEMTRRSE